MLKFCSSKSLISSIFCFQNRRSDSKDCQTITSVSSSTYPRYHREKDCIFPNYYFTDKRFASNWALRLETAYTGSTSTRLSR